MQGTRFKSVMQNLPRHRVICRKDWNATFRGKVYILCEIIIVNMFGRVTNQKALCRGTRVKKSMKDTKVNSVMQGHQVKEHYAEVSRVKSFIRITRLKNVIKG
jgi:hypothetical protein